MPFSTISAALASRILRSFSIPGRAFSLAALAIAWPWMALSIAATAFTFPAGTAAITRQADQTNEIDSLRAGSGGKGSGWDLGT